MVKTSSKEVEKPLADYVVVGFTMDTLRGSVIYTGSHDDCRDTMEKTDLYPLSVAKILDKDFDFASWLEVALVRWPCPSFAQPVRWVLKRAFENVEHLPVRIRNGWWILVQLEIDRCLQCGETLESESGHICGGAK